MAVPDPGTAAASSLMEMSSWTALNSLIEMSEQDTSTPGTEIKCVSVLFTGLYIIIICRGAII